MNALEFNYWLKHHVKLLITVVVFACILGELIFQIIYPSSMLIPGTKLDGVDIGGMSKKDAAKKLDKVYANIPVKIYFGSNQAAFKEPKTSDIGISVNNSERVQTVGYSFAQRIIPFSILWAGGAHHEADITYNYDKDKINEYTMSQVGIDCTVPPQNATLKLIGSQLQLVPALAGGTCDINHFQQVLAEATPVLDKVNSVRIDIDETGAPVTDDMARSLAAMLNARMSEPVKFQVDKSIDTVPGRVVLSWLDFYADVPKQSIDNSGNLQASLKYKVNTDRMVKYLNQGIASDLIIKPGTNLVTTVDFKETKRVNGTAGRGMDVDGIADQVMQYIASKTQIVKGVTVVVPASTKYTRNYTPTETGFRALVAQFAEDHPGKWGIAFNETGGVRDPRSATYNADAQFRAEGIHSLFIAYTYVMKIADKTARPVDMATDTLTTSDCFKIMLQSADLACTRGLYKYFGYEALTASANELGLKNTIFKGDDTVTSANDVQKTMLGLFEHKIANKQSGQTIYETSRNSKIKDGFPQGADRQDLIGHITGESDTIHNDVGVINNPSGSGGGTYVLTALSDGASWKDVGDLVKAIETLRAVKRPLK